MFRSKNSRAKSQYIQLASISLAHDVSSVSSATKEKIGDSLQSVTVNNAAGS